MIFKDYHRSLTLTPRVPIIEVSIMLGRLFLKSSASLCLGGKFLIILLVVLGVSIFSQDLGEEESKPLLRVFPIFRPEECEWSIRFDICLRCIKKREHYAQKIYFMKDGGPFREHGCYTDEKGFYVLR